MEIEQIDFYESTEGLEWDVQIWKAEEVGTSARIQGEIDEMKLKAISWVVCKSNTTNFS